MYWGNGSVKIEVRIGVQKMAEDARECAPEEAPALFVHKLAGPLSSVLQARPDVGEEAKMADIVLGVRVGSVLIADGTERLIGPHHEVPKNGNMLAQ